MRIESLHIDGFGIFRGTRMENLSPGLSVFCGPNESGKSTLLGFMRFMLFGFPDKRTKTNRYPPFEAEAKHGGSIVLYSASARYHVQRHDKLQILLSDGSAGGDSDLIGLLGGVTRDTFINVFGFSLQELQQLGDAFDAGIVRDALYGAATGLNHQLLASAEQHVDENLTRLFKPRSKRTVISTGLAELERLQQEIRKAETDVACFDELGAHVASLEQAAQNLHRRQQEIRMELRRLDQMAGHLERRGKLRTDIERLLADQGQLHLSRSAVRLDPQLLLAAPEIHKLQQGRNHLLALRGGRPTVRQALDDTRGELAACTSTLGPEWTPDRILAFSPPTDFLGAIGAHAARLQGAEVSVAEGRGTERARAQERDTALEDESNASAAFESMPEPPRVPDAVLFERLRAGRVDYERATSDLRARAGELRAADEDLRRSLAEIDPRWTEEDLDRFDTSLPARQELQRFRERVASASQAVERAREQLAQAALEEQRADEQRRVAQDRLDAAPQGPCDDLATLNEWRDVQRRLALRWASMPRSLRSRWLAPSLAVTGLIIGSGLCFFKPVWGGLVVAAAFAASAWFWRLDRLRRTAHEGLQAEFTGLCGRLNCDRPLSDDSILEIERALDVAAETIRQRQFLRQQLEQASKDAAEATVLTTRGRADLHTAQTALEHEAEAWRQHLGTVGLPASLSPEDAMTIVSRVEVCRERQDKVRTLRHRIQAMERNREEYLGVLNDLLAARGQPPASHTDLSVRLMQFLDSVQKENDIRDRRQSARDGWISASEKRRKAQEDSCQRPVHTRGRSQNSSKLPLPGANGSTAAGCPCTFRPLPLATSCSRLAAPVNCWSGYSSSNRIYSGSVTKRQAFSEP